MRTITLYKHDDDVQLPFKSFICHETSSVFSYFLIAYRDFTYTKYMCNKLIQT